MGAGVKPTICLIQHPGVEVAELFFDFRPISTRRFREIYKAIKIRASRKHGAVAAKDGKKFSIFFPTPESALSFLAELASNAEQDLGYRIEMINDRLWTLRSLW